MNEQDLRMLLLALVRSHMELQNELVALRLLLEDRQFFTSADYSASLEHIQAARRDLGGYALKPDAQTLDDWLQKLLDLERPDQGPGQGPEKEPEK